jgi:hypothetical protein
MLNLPNIELRPYQEDIINRFPEVIVEEDFINKKL